MTRMVAFGEPRLDADLASIIAASEAAGKPGRKITPRFQHRVIAGGVLALFSALGLAQFLANPIEPATRTFVPMAATATIPPAPPQNTVPEMPEAAPEKAKVAVVAKPPRPQTRSAPARRPGKPRSDPAATPDKPPARLEHAGYSPYAVRAAPKKTPPVAAGPRGTVRFPDAAPGTDANRSEVLISGYTPTEPPPKRTMFGRRGPRHVREFRR